GDVPEGRDVVTAQTQFTPATGQADGRTATEVETTSCLRTTPAGVVLQSAFQPEGSGEAATQVFRATEAQTRAVVAGVGQGGNGLAAGNDVAADGRVNDTEQGDGRLGGGRASRGHNGHGNQGLFHASFSKVKHRAPVRMGL